MPDISKDTAAVATHYGQGIIDVYIDASTGKNGCCAANVSGAGIYLRHEDGRSWMYFAGDDSYMPQSEVWACVLALSLIPTSIPVNICTDYTMLTEFFVAGSHRQKFYSMREGGKLFSALTERLRRRKYTKTIVNSMTNRHHLIAHNLANMGRILVKDERYIKNGTFYVPKESRDFCMWAKDMPFFEKCQSELLCFPEHAVMSHFYAYEGLCTHDCQKMYPDETLELVSCVKSESDAVQSLEPENMETNVMESEGLEDIKSEHVDLSALAFSESPSTNPVTKKKEDDDMSHSTSKTAKSKEKNKNKEKKEEKKKTSENFDFHSGKPLPAVIIDDQPAYATQPTPPFPSPASVKSPAPLPVHEEDMDDENTIVIDMSDQREKEVFNGYNYCSLLWLKNHVSLFNNWKKKNGSVLVSPILETLENPIAISPIFLFRVPFEDTAFLSSNKQFCVDTEIIKEALFRTVAVHCASEKETIWREQTLSDDLVFFLRKTAFKFTLAILNRSYANAQALLVESPEKEDISPFVLAQLQSLQEAFKVTILTASGTPLTDYFYSECEQVLYPNFWKKASSI